MKKYPNHSFTWMPVKNGLGYAFCQCCGHPVQYDNLKRHVQSLKHLEMLREQEKQERQMKQIALNMSKIRLVGSERLHESQFKERLNVLDIACQANASISGIISARKLLEPKFGPLGSDRGLTDLIPIQREAHAQLIRKLLAGRHQHYAFIVDASPFRDDFLIFITRYVDDKTRHIVSLVSKVKMYKSTLKGVELANQVHRVLKKVLELPRRDCRLLIADRASSNKACVTRLVDHHGYNGMTFFPCFCHGLMNGTKRMEYPTGKECLTLSNQVFKHGLSKARESFNEIFNQPIERSSAVRWHCEHAQVTQLDRIGVDRFHIECIKPCVAQEFSKATSKLLDAFLSDPYTMAIVLVEFGAITDAGVIFCTLTFFAESDQPLIFVAESLFRPLIELVSHANPSSKIKWDRLDACIDRALEFVEKAMQKFFDRIEQASLDLGTKKAALKNFQSEYKKLVPSYNFANDDPDANDSSKKRPRSAATKNNARRQLQDANVTELYESIQDAKQAVVDAKATLQKAQNTFETWKKGKHLTKDALYRHGKARLDSSIKYIISNMLEPSGDYFHPLRAAQAASVFNPLEMKGKSQQELAALLDHLPNFGYPEFSPGFIEALKADIPFLKGLYDATSDDSWSNINGAMEYDAGTIPASDGRGKGRPRTKDSWREDPVETARRIWEFWRVKMISGVKTIPNALEEALCLVALAQLSSTSVERVFSQLKHIVETVCVSGLEDMYELRVFARTNAIIYELLGAELDYTDVWTCLEH